MWWWPWSWPIDPLDLTMSVGTPDRNQANATLGKSNTHPKSARSFLNARISQPIGWNRFLYGGADPVNRIDPTGRDDASIA
jgi:hypothetical protein